MNPLAPVITVLVSLLLVWLARAFDSAILFQLYLGVTSVFMVLLVLVQKGRGGGLAGALGGPGGSSAFGAKAGDIFTRITILAAVVWVIFAIGASLWAKQGGNAFGTGGGESKKQPATDTASSSGESVPVGGKTPSPPTPPTVPVPGPDLGEASGEGSTPESTLPAEPPANSPDEPNP